MDCKNKTKTRLRSNYSYYRILIVTLSDYLYASHMQTIIGTASFLYLDPLT